MSSEVIYVTERTVVTLGFFAMATILLLQQAALGPYAQMVAGGLMTALGLVMNAWFVAHRQSASNAQTQAKTQTQTQDQNTTTTVGK